MTKVALIYALLTAVVFFINFGIYNYSFNIQATPFLSEEQRVDSGLHMLKVTLPLYMLASVLTTMVFHYVMGKFNCDR